ncbi:MAG TPA: caspase family protein [Thermoanaerobaculia bacterium]|nr:caspase family protein [Thermoanaerobaculia bacterium]
MSGFGGGFAVVIGISGYTSLPRLPLAVLNDAVDVARTLWDPHLCGYRADRVRLLLEGEATADGIRSALDWLSESCGTGDTALLYFSGHGWRRGEGQGSEWYLAGFDAERESLPNGMLPGTELTARLAKVRAGRLAAALDCCYAAGAATLKGGGTAPSRPGLTEADYERLAQGRGRMILASSRPDETSLVLEGDRNSLFTGCLLRGLAGEAGDGEEIRVLDLFRFVSGEVPVRSGNRQHPILKGEMENDFPLALRQSSAAPDQRPEGADPLPATPGQPFSNNAGRDIHQFGNVRDVTINNR